MTTSATDICDHLAALVIHLPGENPDAGHIDDILLDLRNDAHDERIDYAAQLRLAWEEGEVDPLLAEIALQRGRMLAAEARMRQLIAYGREFVRPRPYRLEDLAVAAGMSISGVRTAYDDDELDAVAAATGLKPRRPSVDG